MKIAVYDPVPRICGPSTCVPYLVAGFRALGHQCESVTFTKSGKPKAHWGRSLRDKAIGQSMTYRPDRTGRDDCASSVLDEYDLIILIEAKCPPQDNEALKEDAPFPFYVDALMGSRAPFTTAIYGCYYFEPHEVPVGYTVPDGVPFLEQLLGLDTFTGFVMEHAPDGFCSQHCARLRATRRAYQPMPYELQCTEQIIREMLERPNEAPTLLTLGRCSKRKYKHWVNHMAIRGWLPGWRVVHAGGAPCSMAPSESYRLYEQFMKQGWAGQREEGVVRSVPWRVWRDGDPTSVEYFGAYGHPEEVFSCPDMPPGGFDVFVGITDDEFSGQQLECSTLEAMDYGCVPVIPRGFQPPHSDELTAFYLPHHVHGHHGDVRDPETKKGYIDTTSDLVIDEITRDLAALCHQAREARSREVVEANREFIRKYYDPRIICQTYLDRWQR